MNSEPLDKETVQARIEILKLLRVARKETKKLRLQWEEISNILCKDNNKKAA